MFEQFNVYTGGKDTMCKVGGVQVIMRQTSSPALRHSHSETPLMKSAEYQQLASPETCAKHEPTARARPSSRVPLAWASCQVVGNLDEDRFAVAEAADHALFSVFDGHAGPQAASKCGADLHAMIWRAADEQCHGALDDSLISKKENVVPRSDASTVINSTNSSNSANSTPGVSHEAAFDLTTSDNAFFPKECITNAYVSLDEEFKKYPQNYGNSGTTATTLAVEQTEISTNLRIAWAGDSRCIVIRNGKVDAAIEDHKPSLLRERDRVELERQDSFIGTFRISPGGPKSALQLFAGHGKGCTAMTRSIGDADKARCLIPDPEFLDVSLQVSEPARIVLATDGVWDVLDNDAVCALVAAIADPSAAAKAIASRTRVLMKELRIRIDDITVLVVDVHGYSNTCPPPRSQVIHAASCNPGCVMM